MDAFVYLGSRLSSNDPATAARASVGSTSASFRITAASAGAPAKVRVDPGRRTVDPRLQQSALTQR
jgi:hypothetical protein